MMMRAWSNLYGAVLFAVALTAASANSQTLATKPTADAMQQETRVQREYALKAYLSEYNRIEQVVYPLLRVGAPYCSDKRQWSLGAAPRSAAQLGEEDQAAAFALGIDAGLTFGSVLEQTPLVLAGVQVGDKLLSINDQSTPRSKENVGWYIQTIHNLGQKREPIRLALQRGTATFSVSVRAHYICGVNLRYVLNDSVNAFANVSDLIVTSGMLRFAPEDEELALVLGHELAHTILRHPEEKVNQQRTQTAVNIFTILLGRRAVLPPMRDPYSQDKENDADYLGIYLAAAAGFDVTQVAEFWRRMAARNPASIKESHSATHPSAPERFLKLQAAANEISEKQKTGQRLLPNLALLKTAYEGEYVIYDGRTKTVKKPSKANVADGKVLPDFTQVPYIGDNGRVAYQRLLASKTRPRAFAISPSGNWAGRTGANAAADALDSCNSNAPRKDCELYVVNDDFVFTQTTASEKRAASKAEPQTIPASVDDQNRQKAWMNVALRNANPATQFAKLDDIDAVPYLGPNCKERYAQWIKRRNPKAFAISDKGYCSYTATTNSPEPGLAADPAERALQLCAKDGARTCHLYAIDDDVVWKPQ
jgi:Peptidase family M48